MKRWGADLGCSFLALLAAGAESFLAPFALRATSRVVAGGRRQTARGLSMIIPRPEWGYVYEEVDEFPEYVPNMDAPGDSKPGSTPEAYPAEELPLDDFEHGGAFECEFHDLPSLERPVFMGMKAFIDQEGLALLPSEAEMLERDVQVERKRRAEARKERFADEPDEDLVDDTLDDIPLGTDMMAATDASAPSVDFDENDAYDDGYESVDIADISGVEDAMY